MYKIRLSSLGLKFAKSKTMFEKLKCYTDAINILTKDVATEMVELLSTDYRFDYINILEFMYIISDNRIHVTYGDKNISNRI